ALRQNDVVLCTGPAGTGKTYLAVAMALKYLKDREVERLVLCRPAVEAGEELGFLPGDMYAKINPYLRPLYDALYDMMGVDTVRRYIQKDIIEILPLAFVRGRTLSDAYIILDEGQNCTVGQMKTFLTRLGTGSRLVVTGDVTQSDLPAGQTSGLMDARQRLTGVEGIGFAELTEEDIVRHGLVRDIVDAYERDS
ncbi:MAG: PhoH family protein, partial [Planctomycetota bacterium]